tara:strand:- start:811 stop:999 length:189 start_codon:yes stop_codon:yes gene_type:complete
MKQYEDVLCEWDTLDDKLVLMVWDTSDGAPDLLGIYESEDTELVKSVVEQRFGCRVPNIVYH